MHREYRRWRHSSGTECRASSLNVRDTCDALLGRWTLSLCPSISQRMSFTLDLPLTMARGADDYLHNFHYSTKQPSFESLSSADILPPADYHNAYNCMSIDQRTVISSARVGRRALPSRPSLRGMMARVERYWRHRVEMLVGMLEDCLIYSSPKAKLSLDENQLTSLSYRRPPPPAPPRYVTSFERDCEVF